MSDAMITAESAKLIAEVEAFLKNEIADMEIFEESQKVAAVKIGNELQKKYRAVEDARKREKGVWDEKAKAVQNEFKPILDLIGQKKNTLAAAITKYDQKKELERQRHQAMLEAVADAERKKLEAFAGKREDRAAMYQKKLDEKKAELNSVRNDPEAARVVIREIAYYEDKVREFTAKAAETTMQAASVVAPIYQPEAAAPVAGARKKMVCRVDITDAARFLRWCLDNNELQFVMIMESTINARLRETEGRFQAPGIVCSYTQEMTFSGRG